MFDGLRKCVITVLVMGQMLSIVDMCAMKRKRGFENALSKMSDILLLQPEHKKRKIIKQKNKTLIIKEKEKIEKKLFFDKGLENFDGNFDIKNEKKELLDQIDMFALNTPDILFSFYDKIVNIDCLSDEIIAVALENKQVHFFNTKKKEKLVFSGLSHARQCLIRQSDKIFIGACTGVYILNVEKKNLYQAIKMDSKILCMTLLSDGSLAVVSENGVMSVWDTKKFEKMCEYQTGSVSRMISLSNLEIAMAQEAENCDKVIICSPMAEKQKEIFTYAGKINCISTVCNGTLLAIGCDQFVNIVDVKTQKILRTLVGHEASVDTIKVLSADRFATVSCDGKIIIWDIEKGKMIKEFNQTVTNNQNLNGGFCCVEFLSDGRLVKNRCFNDMYSVIMSSITTNELENLSVPQLKLLILLQKYTEGDKILYKKLENIRQCQEFITLPQNIKKYFEKKACFKKQNFGE